MFKNERGVTAIETILVSVFFITTITFATPIFKNVMGQNGEPGFVNNVIQSKAQETRDNELTVTPCPKDFPECELED